MKIEDALNESDRLSNRIQEINQTLAGLRVNQCSPPDKVELSTYKKQLISEKINCEGKLGALKKQLNIRKQENTSLLVNIKLSEAKKVIRQSLKLFSLLRQKANLTSEEKDEALNILDLMTKFTLEEI